jgi:putative spermidine/putrescine transport system ATP-binding protein
MKHDFNELRLDRVTRRFAGVGGHAFNALDEMTLTVRRGEFIALLGPSGCGKSTALNCIAGLLALSGGTIHLDDVRIDTLPPERRGFGMVFQNYALFPHMSVAKNVGFGLKMRGVPGSQITSRVVQALSLVQLSGQEHKLPGQLSGGQQQRVAIARAIVIEPPLILMDEPLSNLDAKLRLETRSEIRRIHRELGRATMYVTHDQDEALSLADRIVVMKDGVVQQIGTPEAVYAEPANLHVARFMGYRNVMELPVTAERDGHVMLRAADSELRGVRKLPLEGGRAMVAIRPEEITLAGSRDDDNVMTGRVDNVEYGGRDSLVEIVTRDGMRLHVRAVGRFLPGADVFVRVPPERVLVYPSESVQ